MVSVKTLTFLIAFANVVLALPAGAGTNAWLKPRTNSLDGGLKLDFSVSHGPKKGSSTHQKRGEIETGLSNQGIYYSANLAFGSQQDVIAVDIDTGSSDLWVIAPNAQCVSPGPGQSADYCLQYGTFNVSESTTAQDQNQSFLIGYGDGSGASGEYYSDQVSISGITVYNSIFAVANLTSTTPGIFGIGYEANEAAQNEYVNFPAQLVQQGLISKEYYSLYLDGPNSTTGSIIFGGIDSTKYTGKLTTLPIVSTNQFLVVLSSLTSGPFATPVNYPVLLDSGTTITYLEQANVDAIAKLYKDPVFNNQQGLYQVSGPLPTGNLTYHFGTAEIEIPLASLVEPAFDINGNPIPGYFLDIGYYSQGGILGDTFLKWAYVVYDLPDYEVSLAQSKFT